MTAGTDHPLSPMGSSPLKGERGRLRDIAKSLRRGATDHERKLWHDLKTIEGTRFRRQVIIGRHIVDFACHQTKTVIELDGSQHAKQEHLNKDMKRDNWLKSEGYSVLRFWNFDTELERDGIVDAINFHLASRSPLRGELSSDSETEGVQRASAKQKHDE